MQADRAHQAREFFAPSDADILGEFEAEQPELLEGEVNGYLSARIDRLCASANVDVVIVLILRQSL